MRWLIGLFLILNLSFFLWSGFTPSGNHLLNDLPEPNVGSLRLMKEVRLSQVQAPPDHPINAALLTKPNNVDEAIVNDQAKADTVITKATELKPASPSLLAEVEQVASPPIEQIIKQRAEQKRLVLEKIKEQPVEQTSVGKKINDLKPGFCTQGGEYKQLIDAETASGQLEKGVSVVAIEAHKTEVSLGYYVMIPAANNLAKAKKTVAALKRKGIRDTWLFRSGKFKHAISLGLFSQKENALIQVKKITAKGFKAIIAKKRKTLDRYQVVIKAKSADLLENAVNKLALANPKKVICP